MKIKYNGTLLNNIVHIKNYTGLGLPVTRDAELEFDTFNGGIYEDTFFEGRVITLECMLTNSINKTAFQKLDDLKRIIAPVGGEKKIEFDMYPDRYFLGRYSGNMNWNVESTMHSFPLSFKCSYPFAISNQIYTESVSSTSVINNIGTYKTDKIECSCTLSRGSRLTINNQTTGKSLILENTSTGSITYKIDFEHALITNSTGTTSYNNHYVAGTFFELVPGENRITTTSPITLKYNALYL